MAVTTENPLGEGVELITSTMIRAGEEEVHRIAHASYPPAGIAVAIYRAMRKANGVRAEVAPNAVNHQSNGREEERLSLSEMLIGALAKLYVIFRRK